MDKLVLAVILAAPALAANAVVLRPVLNMYSKPSEDADVVSQAIYGTNIEVLEERGEFARIRTPDNYTGWAPRPGLLGRERAYAASGKVAEVAALYAHLYREPSVTKHGPLLTVPFETQLEVAAEPEQEERRWLEVRLADGRTAWVQRGDISLERRALTVAEMIELAKRFQGLPYTWGGTSSFGYDCSGFAQMLCRRRGYTLPRDAQPQARWSRMKRVSKGELQAGDLLYFGPSENKITHTGLYLGGGEFIHATAHLKPVVQISRLDEEHWTKVYVGAGRIE